ncbi:MAG TPA: hypothetical protein VGJ93_05900 [Desulfuromonadaceae bacterium]|jgi:hypothetical protein
MKAREILVLGITAALIAGCSGGSGTATGGGQATGLSVANKVTAVDPKASTVGKALAKALLLPTFDTTSDYSKDKTFTYVQDRSTDALANVNQILCMIGQTRYAEMVNKGGYKALVDQNLCGGNDTSSSGGAPDYRPWTVNVTRADNSSPQVIQAWVHEKNQGSEKLITAKMVITEGASALNPTGIFEIDYAQFPAANGVPTTTTPAEKGILKAVRDTSGKIVLSMVSNGTQGSSQIAFSKSADGSAGSGSTKEAPAGGILRSLDFAYDANTVKAAPSGTAAICLDRTNVDLAAWSYGLYDATGARVNVNAGFPIKVTHNGTELQGWIGYFGPWLPNNEALVNGEAVTRLDNSGTSAGSYNALNGYGRLVKHSQKLLSMADIKGIPLRYTDMSQSSPQGPPQYRVTWDGTNLVEDATWDNTSHSWASITPQNLALSALRNPSLNMWSEGLGGQAFLKASCSPNSGSNPQTFSCSLSGTTAVIFYAESTVFPGDTSVPTTLACASGCPNPAGGVVNGMMAQTETGMQMMSPANVQFATYTFDRQTYGLTRGGVKVDGTAISMGLNSGPLFDPASTSNLAALQCNNNGTPNSSQTCGWQSWSNLPEFYTWSSGPNNWQVLSTLKDSNGAFVSFAQPLQVLYAHSGDGYTNASFFLQYNGFGNLNGIPGKCVNMDTGLPADCSTGGQGTQIRWVPKFTIKAGESVTGPNNTTYYVKPLQVEQRMKPAAPGACNNLTTTAYPLPALSTWTDPALGAEPSVTGPAKVIGGVIQ